jgi:hypothetical protein
MNVLDLAPELREMVGNLRGRDPPPEDVLRRLRDMNPQYRVTWTPATLDRVVAGRLYRGRPGLWWLHEVRPTSVHDRARRAAGAARLARYRRRSADGQQRNLGVESQCEDMMAGYWTVGLWPEVPAHGVPSFGSEPFFLDVRYSERVFKDEKRRVEYYAALDDAADHEAITEYDENPAFRAELADQYRQGAIEDWALIFKGKRSVVSGGLNQPAAPKEQPDAGTDGQQVARPRYGEDRQSA